MAETIQKDLVVLSLTPDQRRYLIDEVHEMTGTVTNGELVRHALMTYRSLVELVRQGYTLYAENERYAEDERGRKRTILLPDDFGIASIPIEKKQIG